MQACEWCAGRRRKNRPSNLSMKSLLRLNNLTFHVFENMCTVDGTSLRGDVTKNLENSVYFWRRKYCRTPRPGTQGHSVETALAK